MYVCLFTSNPREEGSRKCKHFEMAIPTSLEYRSGNEDCVHMCHVQYIKCLYCHSARRPVFRYYRTGTKWSECIFYRAE